MIIQSGKTKILENKQQGYTKALLLSIIAFLLKSLRRGRLTPKKEVPLMKDNNGGSFPPWSRTVSLPEMLKEAGIDYDEFIEAIKNDVSPAEIAKKLKVSEDTVIQMTEYFYRYGISSVIGGD